VKVPPGYERTDVKDLLKRAQSATGLSGDEGMLGRLFGGDVKDIDVLAGEPEPDDAATDARLPSAPAPSTGP
jgi:hypothetical protein